VSIITIPYGKQLIHLNRMTAQISYRSKKHKTEPDRRVL